jgi:hypothetical protein
MSTPFVLPGGNRIQRYHSDLEIAAGDGIRRNGADGRFYVQSQTGNGDHLVNLNTDVPTCTCDDFAFRGSRLSCKHIIACSFYRQAEDFARTLAQDYGMSFAQLASYILADTEGVTDEGLADKMRIVALAAQRLANDGEINGQA